MDNKNAASEPQQSEFEKTARALGADESDAALDRIMEKLDLTKKPEADKKPDDRKS